MRALVTGGGGFLGTAIVRQLRARGDFVQSFSRVHHPHLAELGVGEIRGDLRDPAAVEAAVAGSDVVFHVAAKPPPWGHPADYDAINVDGTRHVIDACRAQGVEHLVYTSTPSVAQGGRDVEGGDESLPYETHFRGADYPRTKALAEQTILAADDASLRTVALRPHLIWGPDDPHFLPRFVARARAGTLRRIGTVDPLIDPTYVDDAARAHLLAADRLCAGAPIHGKPYFITGDERIGVWTMINRLLATAGAPPIQRSLPVGLARAAAGLVETTHRLLGRKGEPRVTRFLVEQLTHARWFDLTAARRDLGYAPQISIADGLGRVKMHVQS